MSDVEWSAVSDEGEWVVVSKLSQAGCARIERRVGREGAVRKLRRDCGVVPLCLAAMAFCMSSAGRSFSVCEKSCFR